MKQYMISMGGVLIKLIFPEVSIIQPVAAEAFLSKRTECDIELIITIVQRIDRESFFRADAKTSAWEMRNERDGKRFVFYDADVTMAKLFVTNNFTKAKLQILEDAMHDIMPPLYVMHPIISGFMLSRFLGVFFHGALIEMNGNGIILTGKSGAGKSTLSEMVKKCGHRKLGDDRLVLKVDHETKTLWGYSTPFDLKLNSWENSKMPIRAILSLAHSTNKSNNIERLNNDAARISLSLSNFIPLFSVEHLDRHFQLCNEIYTSVPIYEFSFLPDLSSVRYMEDFFKNVL